MLIPSYLQTIVTSNCKAATWGGLDWHGSRITLHAGCWIYSL